MAVSRYYTSENWMVEYRHYWIEGLRFMLGVLLFYKGVYFVENLSEIYVLIEEAIPVSAFLIAHYVVVAHLVGGLLLALGLYTRLAALVQIPVLLGAVFLVHGQGIFFGPETGFEYTLLVLILLVVFLFYGSGKLSVDHRLIRKDEDSEPRSEPGI